jgi:hypothetical protein
MDYVHVLVRQKKDARRKFGQDEHGYPLLDPPVKESVWKYWAHEITRLAVMRDVRSETNLGRFRAYIKEDADTEESASEFWDRTAKVAFGLNYEYSDIPTDWELFAEAWDETLDEYADWAREKAGQAGKAAKQGLLKVGVIGAGLAGLAAWLGTRGK